MDKKKVFIGVIVAVLIAWWLCLITIPGLPNDRCALASPGAIGGTTVTGGGGGGSSTPPVTQTVTPVNTGGTRLTYDFCTGTNYGLPSIVVYTAYGTTQYTSFECATDADCQDHAPGAYTGRLASLKCCNKECWAR
jgi:hypothetical protein